HAQLAVDAVFGDHVAVGFGAHVLLRARRDFDRCRTGGGAGGQREQQGGGEGEGAGGHGWDSLGGLGGVWGWGCWGLVVGGWGEAGGWVVCRAGRVTTR